MASISVEAQVSSTDLSILSGGGLVEGLSNDDGRPRIVAACSEAVLLIAQEGISRDTLELSGIARCLEVAKRRGGTEGDSPVEPSASERLVEDLELLHEMWHSEEHKALVAELAQSTASDLLNVLIAHEINIAGTANYVAAKNAVATDIQERRKAARHKVVLTQESATWLSLEPGAELDVVLRRVDTQGGRAFLWANIIPNSNQTEALFMAIDPSKRPHIVNAVLDKISASVDTGEGATIPKSSKAGLAREGRFKNTIYPVWKARNIEGSEYRGFTLRAEDVKTDDAENIPVFLVAIACNHTIQNGNHSPVYKGILGGRA